MKLHQKSFLFFHEFQNLSDVMSAKCLIKSLDYRIFWRRKKIWRNWRHTFLQKSYFVATLNNQIGHKFYFNFGKSKLFSDNMMKGTRYRNCKISCILLLWHGHCQSHMTFVWQYVSFSQSTTYHIFLFFLIDQ